MIKDLMKNQPLVSVIITTYNRCDILGRAIKGVLKQTYENLECIVVDDASTDNTMQVVQQFTDDCLVYLRHETNRHLSAARNTGIEHSRGDYIAFLDDDDEWLATKLEKQVRLMQRLPESVGLIYCWMDYYDGNEAVSERHPELRGSIFKYVLESQPLGNGSTLLVRRSVIKEVGGFDEALPRGIDGNFIRRVCLDYEVDFVPEVLVRVYVGHGYERITSKWDADGIWYAIKSQEVKLTKFKDELPKYPRQTANILASIGFYYSLLPDWKNCVRFLLQAIVKSATSTTVHAYMRKSLKNFVKSMR